MEVDDRFRFSGGYELSKAVSRVEWLIMAPSAVSYPGQNFAPAAVVELEEVIQVNADRGSRTSLCGCRMDRSEYRPR